MKQETLEEAAERYVENYKWEEEQDPWFDFMEGAKWQAERMYSEEDLREAFYAHNQSWIDYEEWFEQFKNKGGDK
jgi:hypothetical protein